MQVRLTAARAVAAVVLGTRDDGRGRTRVVANPPPDAAQAPKDWVAGTDANLGWTFERPAAWTAQSYDEHCRLSVAGTVITNLGRPLAPEPGPPTSCPRRRDFASVPDGFVGVQMGHYVGGPAYIRSPDGPTDTTFPLAQRAAQPELPGARGRQREPSARSFPVTVNGDSRYHVRIWTGAAASAEDLARAERIVASIRLTPSPQDGPTPAPVECPAGVNRTDLRGRPAVHRRGDGTAVRRRRQSR